jgi:hypothetical protein
MSPSDGARTMLIVSRPLRMDSHSVHHRGPAECSGEAGALCGTSILRTIQDQETP